MAAEKYSRRALSISHKLNSLRKMVEEIEKIKKTNLSSPDIDIAARSEIIASKAQEYEAVFKTYGQSLKSDKANEIAKILEQNKLLSDTAIKKKGADGSYQDYIENLAMFVTEMEKAPHDELEIVAAAFKKLSS